MESAIINRPDISIIIPAYNEEENALKIIEATIDQVLRCDVSFEIIVIDNASTDATASIVKDICSRDSRVKLIVNSRNFGQMRSPTHAIYQARGRAVLGLAADFQDPPELIPELISLWKAGAEIVLCVRKAEVTAGWILKVIRQLSYWAAHHFSDYPVIPNATGFGIFDAKVIEATRNVREPEPFLRGMLLEAGFKVTLLPYDRPARAAGSSKNGFFGLLQFATSALASSSKRLLGVPLYFGAFGLLISLIMLLSGIVAYSLDSPFIDWFIGAAAQTQISMIFIFLGVFGKNLKIVSERTRNTPLVIERERINFGEDR